MTFIKCPFKAGDLVVIKKESFNSLAQGWFSEPDIVDQWRGPLKVKEVRFDSSCVFDYADTCSYVGKEYQLSWHMLEAYTGNNANQEEQSICFGCKQPKKLLISLAWLCRGIMVCAECEIIAKGAAALALEARASNTSLQNRPAVGCKCSNTDLFNFGCRCKDGKPV